MITGRREDQKPGFPGQKPEFVHLKYLNNMKDRYRNLPKTSISQFGDFDIVFWCYWASLMSCMRRNCIYQSFDLWLQQNIDFAFKWCLKWSKRWFLTRKIWFLVFSAPGNRILHMREVRPQNLSFLRCVLKKSFFFRTYETQRTLAPGAAHTRSAESIQYCEE